MALVSVFYLIGLLIAMLFFYGVPSDYKRWVLVFFSALFIGLFNFASLFLLLLSSTITFFAASKIRAKKWVFWAMMTFHIVCLFGLKYLFVPENSLGDVAHFQQTATIVFLGVSFYTLQNIGYLLAIYRGQSEPSTDFIAFFTFHAFFPKIASGPIESYDVFGRSLETIGETRFSTANLIYGIQRIALGFFKKMVLADRLAPLVANVYGLESPATGLTLWVGICLFTLQLYFDFSGYMDIVLGSARLFNIRLSENFNRPLSATSISELWRKWHITLIAWLTQFIYYPIVYRMRKHNRVGVLFATAVVFILSGYWHGVGLTFLVWAVWNMLCLWYEILTKKTRVKWSKNTPQWIYRPLSIFITFNVFSLGLLFFRSASIADGLLLLKGVFTGAFLPQSFLNDFVYLLGMGGTQEHLFNFYSTTLFCMGFLLLEKNIYGLFYSEKISSLSLVVLVVLICMFGIFEAGSNFIYLQF